MSTINSFYKTKLFQEEVAKAMHEMFKLGYLPYDGFGEASVRDSETGFVYISVQPGQFHVRTPEDYHGCDTVVVDSDGNPLTDYTKASSALPLHLAIYRARPEIHAIAHTESIWTSLFSAKGKGIPFILEEQAEIGGITKCVNTDPKNKEEYYADVVAALGSRNTVILKNNGVIAVAENADRAINYLAWIEAVARKAVRASLIGKVNIIPSDDPDYQL